MVFFIFGRRLCTQVLGASGGALGFSWRLSGASWGAPGVLLGGPGGLLGASWGVPGPPGGVLGASWGRLGALLGPSFLEMKFWSFFLIDFGTEKGAQRGGFGSQNESKIVPKTKTKTKTKKRLSWEPLGSILGRLGEQFGTKKPSNLLVGLEFREKRRFWRQDAFKSDPGTKKEPKRLPRPPPKRPQDEKKSIQNRLKILVKF